MFDTLSDRLDGIFKKLRGQGRLSEIRRWWSRTRWPARSISISRRSRSAPDQDGKPVYLADIWPSDIEVQDLLRTPSTRRCSATATRACSRATTNWTSIKVPAGKLYTWDSASTYVKNPPYFDGMTMTPPPLADIRGARALAVLGDSVTTDHISPAGNIAKSSPAARYLVEQGVRRWTSIPTAHGAAITK